MIRSPTRATLSRTRAPRRCTPVGGRGQTGPGLVLLGPLDRLSGVGQDAASVVICRWADGPLHGSDALRPPHRTSHSHSSPEKGNTGRSEFGLLGMAVFIGGDRPILAG